MCEMSCDWLSRNRKAAEKAKRTQAKQQSELRLAAQGNRHTANPNCSRPHRQADLQRIAHAYPGMCVAPSRSPLMSSTGFVKLAANAPTHLSRGYLLKNEDKDKNE